MYNIVLISIFPSMLAREYHICPCDITVECTPSKICIFHDLLCFFVIRYSWTLPISFRIPSLVLGQSHGKSKLQNRGIILGMGSSNEKRHYNVTSFLTGWALLQNDPWKVLIYWTSPIYLVFQLCRSTVKVMAHCEWGPILFMGKRAIWEQPPSNMYINDGG